MKISVQLRNEQLEKFKAEMDGCLLYLYGSPVSQAAANALIPATADAAIGSATLICTVSVNGAGTGLTFDTAPSNGVISKNPSETLTGTVAATGYYSFARLAFSTDAGGVATTEKRAQLTVGTVNAEVIVNSMYKTIGDSQPITSLTIGQPAS